MAGGCFNDEGIKDMKCAPLTIYGLYGDGYVIICSIKLSSLEQNY